MLVAAPEKKVHMAQGLTDIVFQSETTKPPPPPGWWFSTHLHEETAQLAASGSSFFLAEFQCHISNNTADNEELDWPWRSCGHHFEL
jgi:hypothetical protein